MSAPALLPLDAGANEDGGGCTETLAVSSCVVGAVEKRDTEKLSGRKY
jgi:hypothetical protein